MKTYPIMDKEGNLHAFEIENWRVTRARACSIISLIPGAIITKKPKSLFSWFWDDVFCEFEIDGILFQIEEPYGDNSRYWVGKKEKGGWCKELELAQQAFEASP